MFFFSLRRTFFAPPACCRVLGGISLSFLEVVGPDRADTGPEGPCGADDGDYFLPGFFLPAIARRGPLRVRALVWVRWPCTVRARRWRRPWGEAVSTVQR